MMEPRGTKAYIVGGSLLGMKQNANQNANQNACADHFCIQVIVTR